MRFETRLLASTAALLALASCGGNDDAIATASSASVERVSDYPVTLGEPFTIGATKYVPEEAALYDDVGLAGIYGGEMAGKTTANGEPFAVSAISAAHKTLPLPSYVEVTALDTGRTILVRINDRGPMTNERLIDLSEGAARQLGISDKGATGVRVRRVNPPENEKSALRAGQAATLRMDTPESLLKVLRDKLSKQAAPVVTVALPEKPAPVVPAKKEAAKPAKPPTVAKKEEPKPAPVAAKPKEEAKPKAATAGAYAVQVAAFASRANADALAKKLGATVIASSDSKLFRVRFGPFATEKEAQAALADARKRGYPQARLIRD
ncbi:MAG: septal ring lytic transglycosylase RlpA family protein [Sphingomonadales bacterium]|jgi:rare lipoprotein A|nr:septal ring lytic transglycosylase RlpA family protein [Sphingomonadales bacterium]MBK9003641.1 septal ring lytic transglycosylase RlpA family protein [Sphingomonadales bacterium]MBK9268815.1 septal ring lytic transglycosylase RlpA family protein [Sphingomonadales bacterium]